MAQFHYVVIIAIIAVIVYLQSWFYSKTRKKLRVFNKVFPNSDDPYSRKDAGHTDTTNEDENKFFKVVAAHKSPVLNEIISSINKYLVKNKDTVGDFHLMKDIVERHCDSVEEEINTQIPVPLYLGLTGTMAGILIGILYLWLSGGLNDLLTRASGNGGAKGVEALLGGVALAMISSICGIILTTIGSVTAKDVKKNVEKNKNIFLSWIHAELLPELSNNFYGALAHMTKNLTTFNNTFSGNTHELRSILDKVNESYKNQAAIVSSINDLNITEIATANTDIYRKLKNCTEEIGVLGGYLSDVKTYLTEVHRSIAMVGTYCDKEIEQIDERKGVISKAIGEIDNHLQNVFYELKKNAEIQITEFQKTTIKHTGSLKDAIHEQHDALNRRLQESSLIVNELKNLAGVKESMDKLVQITNSQNRKIDILADAISESSMMRRDYTRLFIPKWVKVFALAGFCVISFSCLIFLVKELIKVYNSLFPL